MRSPGDDFEIEGVVFDLDGTLVDSNIDFYEMKRGLISLLEKEKVPEELLCWELTIAEIMENARRYLDDGETENEDLWSSIEYSFKAVEMKSLKEIDVINGVSELLAWIVGSGYGVGILTRASREYAERALAVTDIDHLIDHMICRDDYPWYEAKPDPIAMRRLTSLLGTSPEHCLMVGDHHLDLQCALASGARFIGVLSGSYNEGEWSEAGCMDIVNDVHELRRLLL